MSGFELKKIFKLYKLRIRNKVFFFKELLTNQEHHMGDMPKVWNTKDSGLQDFANVALIAKNVAVHYSAFHGITFFNSNLPKAIDFSIYYFF